LTSLETFTLAFLTGKHFECREQTQRILGLSKPPFSPMKESFSSRNFFGIPEVGSDTSMQSQRSGRVRDF